MTWKDDLLKYKFPSAQKEKWKQIIDNPINAGYILYETDRVIIFRINTFNGLFQFRFSKSKHIHEIRYMRKSIMREIIDLHYIAESLKIISHKIQGIYTWQDYLHTINCKKILKEEEVPWNYKS